MSKGQVDALDGSRIGELYARYGGIVLRRARAILRDEDRARDAMHDVFVQIIRTDADFRGEASPVTWLYRVTTNVCLNIIREQGRRTTREQRAVPEHPTSRDDVETQLLVQQLLAQLPEAHAQVAVYAFVDRMKQEEIASLLGVSERTVRTRIREFQELAQELLAPKEAAS